MFCPRCRTEYREGFTTCADCNVDLVDELAPETDDGYVEYEEVLATYNPGDIAVINSMLESEDITYYFQGEHLTLRPMGDAARLMVKKDEAQSVRELLSDLDLAYSEASSFKDEDEPEEEPEDDTDDA